MIGTARDESIRSIARRLDRNAHDDHARDRYQWRGPGLHRPLSRQVSIRGASVPAGTPSPATRRGPLSGAATSGRGGPRPASWAAARRCGPRCKRGWSSSTAPSRSPGIGHDLSRPPGDAGVPRDHIQSPLRARTRRTAPRTHLVLRTGRAVRKPRNRPRGRNGRGRSRHGQHQ